MNSSSSVAAIHSTAETTGGATVSIRPTAAPAGTASILNNAQNPVISDSIFVNNVNTGSSLKILYKRAAPNAILNARGRADEVKCHPGTREEVIGHIERWTNDPQGGLAHPIFWLTGPAGAGKTAIVQKIAERWKKQAVPHANFFFFRMDTTRNSISPLMATILHQIILFYPSLRDFVATVFSTNPLILDSPLEEQLAELIIAPLRSIQQSSSSYHPLTLLIDGLDECDSENKSGQRQILHAFDKILAEHTCPIRLLVASRDESQIKMAFNEISSRILPIYLSNKYSPQSDIRLFVNAQLQHVRKTHPLAHTLDAAWPFEEDVEEIVEKSSGQFIYADTVVRFILESSASPVLSLERMQGIAEIATKSPFSNLDAIYTYILSQVDDQEALKDILHAHFLILAASQSTYAHHMQNPIPKLAQLLKVHNSKYTQAAIYSTLADLTPLVRYTSCVGLTFHHTSFLDYLLDQSRSRIYFVDIDVFNFTTQPAVWKGIALGVEVIAYYGLFNLKKLPPNLMNTLIALNPSNFNLLGSVWMVKDALERIYDLCACDDDIINYKRIIRGWTNSLQLVDIREGVDGAESPPCSRRYFVMTVIKHDLAIGPKNKITAFLRTEAECDTRETALWLNELLHCIHNQKYSKPDLVQPHQRIKQWISWAVWNNVPLDGLDNIPLDGLDNITNAQSFLRKSRMEKWAISHLKHGNYK